MLRSGAYVVTGAGSGIGRAIVLRLATEGHQVFGVGRDRTKLESTQSEAPGHVQFSTADLARAEDCEQVAEKIGVWLKSVGTPLCGLVNNAGVYDYLPFLQTADEKWEQQFQTNLLSSVRLTRLMYPSLKVSAPSSVLNISSTLGLRPIANTSAYSAMKAAMVSWTKTLALESARDGVRVNCICPGLIDTPIHNFHKASADDPDKVRAHAAQPLGRMGSADEIASAAWFLLSEASAWTTGTILTVDGGISL